MRKEGPIESTTLEHKSKKRGTRLIDLVGKKIGLLTILERDYEKNDDGVYWRCECDCGNSVIRTSAYLRRTKTPSCGCFNPKTNKSRTDGYEIVGKKFDNLTVLYVNGKEKTGHKVMHCRCDCGNEIDVRLYNLLNGSARSCHCRKSRNIEGDDSVIGRKFGRLTILDMYYDEEKLLAMVNCRCECGIEKTIRLVHIKAGRIKSCGCYKQDKFNEHNKRNELANKRFGSLMVLKEELRKNKDLDNGYRTWLCKCDCGNEVIRDTASLMNRRNPSCGCSKRK